MSAKTLSIDVGGTGLKASVLDDSGKMMVERVRIETPQPCPPQLLVKSLAKLVKSLPTFDRVSVGFPGVVRDGIVLTAPNLYDVNWPHFPLAKALEKEWGKPVRILNDADLHGLAVISGKGLESETSPSLSRMSNYCPGRRSGFDPWTSKEMLLDA